MHPEGYYTQLMSKSGLMVLYELEVKAGVIDPDCTGNIGVVLKNNSDKPIYCWQTDCPVALYKSSNPNTCASIRPGEYGFGAHSTH